MKSEKEIQERKEAFAHSVEKYTKKGILLRIGMRDKYWLEALTWVLEQNQ